MEELINKYANTPPAQRYLMVLLLVGALVAGYYYLINDGQQAQLRELRSQLNSKQGVKVEKENIAQNRSTYEAKLRQLQQQLDDARAKLPDSADVAQLLAQLGSRARQTGLLIDQFEPQPEEYKGFYAEIPFTVKARGSYHEVAMFIDAVGRLDRIVNVTNLVLEKPQTEESKVIVSANFAVKTYRFKREGEK